MALTFIKTLKDFEFFKFREVTASPGTVAVAVVNPDGSTVGSAGGGTTTVQGALTHDAAAPAANNVGVLSAVATAASPSLTEGRQGLLSQDLTGNLRTKALQSGTWSVGSNSNTGSAVPSAAFYLGVNNGGTLTGITAVANQGDGVSLSGGVPAGGWRYNNSTWDRERNNVSATALTSSARTAATQSADQTNHNWRGIKVILNVTVASGTGGLQVTVQGKDSISNNYYALNNAPTAVTATGTYVYEVFPGSTGTATGGINQKTDGQVPRTFRVAVAVGDSSSYTYSISYEGEL